MIQNQENVFFTKGVKILFVVMAVAFPVIMCVGCLQEKYGPQGEDCPQGEDNDVDPEDRPAVEVQVGREDKEINASGAVNGMS